MIRHYLLDNAAGRFVSFSGTESRRDYWMTLLWMLPVAISAVTAAAIVDTTALYIAAALTLAALAVATASLSSRRLRDTGHSGALILLALIPAVGIILLLPMLATRGMKRPRPVPATAPADWCLLVAMTLLTLAAVIVNAGRLMPAAITVETIETETVTETVEPADSTPADEPADTLTAADAPWWEGDSRAFDGLGRVTLTGEIDRFDIVLNLVITRGRHGNRIVRGTMRYLMPDYTPAADRSYILTGQIIGNRFIVDQLNTTPRANRIDATVEGGGSSRRPFTLTGTFTRMTTDTPTVYTFKATLPPDRVIVHDAD